jgi:hypothetical protein
MFWRTCFITVMDKSSLITKLQYPCTPWVGFWVRLHLIIANLLITSLYSYFLLTKPSVYTLVPACSIITIVQVRGGASVGVNLPCTQVLESRGEATFTYRGQPTPTILSCPLIPSDSWPRWTPAKITRDPGSSAVRRGIIASAHPSSVCKEQE